MSESSATSRAGRQLRGRHVLMVFVGFFATVFLVDGFMIYQAVSTFGGLETQDAYRRGLAYNARIALGAEQDRRGWRDELTYLPDRGRLRIALTDREREPVGGLAISAAVGRPATNRFDRQLAFTQTGAGAYEADLLGIEPGWWTVEVEARSDADAEPQTVFTSRRRLWIKP